MSINDSAQMKIESTSEQARESKAQQSLSRDCWGQVGAQTTSNFGHVENGSANLSLPSLSLFDGSNLGSMTQTWQPKSAQYPLHSADTTPNLGSMTQTWQPESPTEHALSRSAASAPNDDSAPQSSQSDSTAAPQAAQPEKGNSSNRFDTQLKRDETMLHQQITHLREEGSKATPQAIHQLHQIAQELQQAEANHNPQALKEATHKLNELTNSGGNGGGNGGHGHDGGGNGGSGNGGSGNGGGNGTGGDGNGGGGGNGSGGDGNGGGGGSGTGGDGNGNGGGNGTGGTGGDGVGSTATTFGTSAMPQVDQTAPGFYVSANGSANGDGTAANPFATLQQAQKAMENSDIKTTYVEGGTYNMSSTLKLTSADSGEQFISVGGASNPATLNGGGQLSNLISLNGANNVSIEGFSMENTSNSPVWDSQKHGQVQANTGAIYAENSQGDNFSFNSMNNVNVGVNMQGDSNMNVANNSITNVQSAIDSGSSQNNTYGSNNTIESNLVDNVTGYGSKLFDNVGAINIAGDTNATISNNVIENTAGVGIQMNYRENGSGFTLSNNTITNTDTVATTDKADTSSNPVGDDGAIHIITAPGSTKQLDGYVENNYIDGAGVNRADKGIYLDDGVNGVTVSGNYVNEGGAGDAMQIHGGSNNVVENNTFDLGNGKGILYQTDGYAMTGNEIENNNFVSSGTGTQAYQFSNTDDSDMPLFSGNTYSPGINDSPDSNGTTGSSTTSLDNGTNSSNSTDGSTNTDNTSVADSFMNPNGSINLEALDSETAELLRQYLAG